MEKDISQRIDAWQEHLARKGCLDENGDYFHKYMSKQQYNNVYNKKKRGALDNSTLQAKWRELWKDLFDDVPPVSFGEYCAARIQCRAKADH